MKCPHCGNKLEFMVAEDISRFTQMGEENEDGKIPYLCCS